MSMLSRLPPVTGTEIPASGRSSSGAPTGTTPTVPAADNEGHSQPGKAVSSTRLMVGASKRSSASLGIDSGPPILAMLTAQEVVERLSGEPVRSRNRHIFLSRLSVVSKGSAKP